MKKLISLVLSVVLSAVIFTQVQAAPPPPPDPVLCGFYSYSSRPKRVSIAGVIKIFRYRILAWGCAK